MDSGGAQAEATSRHASLSADGMTVVFESLAGNLVTGDSNGIGDVFVHDRLHGLTRRLNLRIGGAQAQSPCRLPFLSADGRVVAWRSADDQRVSNDTNHCADVFVRDL